MTATDRSIELARLAAKAADDKLGRNILALDVSEKLALTDVFVLVSAPNDRQVRSIVEEVEEQLRKAGSKPVRREGERENRWVLIDFVDIVVHVQHDEERDFYALERLWKDCPVVDLQLPAESTAAAPSGASAGGASASGASVSGVDAGTD